MTCSVTACMKGRSLQSCGIPSRDSGSLRNAVARKILDSLGLPSRPPPVAPARRNPQPTLSDSDGRQTAFADVCFRAGWFRPGLTIAATKSLCVPKKLFFLPDAKILFYATALPQICARL